MNTTNKNTQQGSAHILLVAVIFVAIVGALGYVVWNNYLQPKPESANEASVKATPAKSTEPEVKSTKAGDKEIILADLKIKLTIPDSLSGTTIKYKKHKNAFDGDWNLYQFTTARILALGGDCATQPNGYTVLLGRIDKLSSEPTDVYGGVVEKPIGGYYYTHTETVPGCSGDSGGNNVNQVEIDDTFGLYDLLKSVQSAE